MTTLNNLLVAISIAFLFSCQSPANDATVADEPEYEVVDIAPSMYAVSLAEAEKNIQYYDRISKEVLKVDPIKAFTIRSVDVAEAIGLPVAKLKSAKYSHLRIYMGLDSINADSAVFKIYLTPVDSARLSKGNPGKDVILNGPYRGNGNELGDGDGPYVLDFSQPCPSACDDGSPLNQ